MKKSFLFLVVVAFISATSLMSCGGNTEAKANSDSTAVKTDTAKKDVKVADIYTCTMHPEVISDKPGKCPKCGMDLVKVEKAKVTEVWVCPMKEDNVTSDKAGKCPKCGMDLVKQEKK